MNFFGGFNNVFLSFCGFIGLEDASIDGGNQYVTD